MNEELIAQLQAYDDLVIRMKHFRIEFLMDAERWVENYQQMTGSSKVPLEVLKAIVEHFEAKRDGHI